MIKNPYVNAFLAAVYIVIIVLGIWSAGHMGEVHETIAIPMAMLSLCVLSAAVMGYLFVFEPVQMYLDGKRQEALQFFFKTVGTFAVLTALFAITAIALA